MPYRRLYICIEGPDDEMFFNKVVVPQLQDTYDHIDLFRHAQKSPRKCNKFLSSVKRIPGAEVIWTRDIDRSPCVTFLKDKLRCNLSSIADNPILIVVKEIESWYLAGVDREGSRSLGIQNSPTTDAITKEEFTDIRPQNIKTNREFMLAILDHFSIETAQSKNRSFRYFCQRFFSDEVQLA